MRIYHTYASVTEFKSYLSGAGHTGAWTEDTDVIRRMLAACSRTMDAYIGGRSWGPRVETRAYDIGRGRLRSDARLGGAPVVPLDDWLVEATTVTAGGTALDSDEYLLVPYNQTPKTSLKLAEDGGASLGSGQRALSITGTWGWDNRAESNGTLSFGGPGATGVASNGAGFSVGQTAQVSKEDGSDLEYVYITAVSGNTITCIRGVHGTEDNIKARADVFGQFNADAAIVQYPDDITGLCLEMARNRWRERDGGVTEIIGNNLQMTRPGSEEKALLKRLDYYLGQRERAGVFV